MSSPHRESEEGGAVPRVWELEGKFSLAISFIHAEVAQEKHSQRGNLTGNRKIYPSSWG